MEELPKEYFKGNIFVVETKADIKYAYNALSLEKVIGFDTEHKPQFKKGSVARTSLIQLSTATECFLFQPLLNLSNPIDQFIIDIMESPKHIKVGVDIKDDIRGINKIVLLKPKSFVDIQRMSAISHLVKKGLKSLCEEVLGYSISKREQMSDWEASPLSPSQLIYASTDAWVSRELYLAIKRIEKDSKSAKAPNKE